MNANICECQESVVFLMTHISSSYLSLGREIQDTVIVLEVQHFFLVKYDLWDHSHLFLK